MEEPVIKKLKCLRCGCEWYPNKPGTSHAGLTNIIYQK